MSTGAVYQRMLTGLYPLKDNINKVIAEMSPCPQLLCWKQVHPVEDIGKSPEQWASLNSEIVADAYAQQNQAWASSQWEADNITNEKHNYG